MPLSTKQTAARLASLRQLPQIFQPDSSNSPHGRDMDATWLQDHQLVVCLPGRVLAHGVWPRHRYCFLAKLLPRFGGG